MTNFLRVDISVLSVLVICDLCGWRHTRATPAQGWTSAAIHAKAVHGDTAAVARAREASRSARRRAFANRPA